MTDLTNLRFVTGIIVGPACFALALLVYLYGPRNRLNRIFALSNVSLGFWNAADLVMVLMSQHPLAIYVDRISYFAGVPVIYFFYHLCVEMAEATPPPQVMRGLKWLSGFMAVMMLTPWVLKDVAIIDGRIVETPGPLYPVLIAYFVAYLGYGLYLLFRRYKTAVGVKKNQLRYVFIGLLFAFLAGTSYFLSLLVPSVPAIYYILEAIYLGIFAYAIARHKLMDINLIFRYATIYFLFALTLAIPFSFLSMVYLDPLVSFLCVFAALFFAPLIEKRVIGLFRRFVDRLPPFRGRYQVLGNIPGFQRMIATSSSVKQWAANVVDSINRLLEVRNVAVFVLDEREQMYMMSAAVGAHLPKLMYSSPQTTDPLVLHLREKKHLVQRDYVDVEVPSAHRSGVKGSMDLLGASLCAPFFHGPELIGFVSIGKKVKPVGGMFLPRDLKLEAIRNCLDLPTETEPNFLAAHKALEGALGLKADGDALSLSAEDIARGLNQVASRLDFVAQLPAPEAIGLRADGLKLLARYQIEGGGSEMDPLDVQLLNLAVLRRVFADMLLDVEEEDLFNDEDLKGIWGLIQGAEASLMVILVTLAGQMKTAEWAHDLRHPFTKGSFKLIETILSGRLGAITPETARALMAIREDAGFVERQIKTLIDARTNEIHNAKPVSTHDLLKKVEERYRYVTELSKVHFTLSLPDADNKVLCDREMIMYRVFTNLIDNALRYTPEGGVLEVGYVPNGRYVKCYVTNKGGMVIPEDILPHIFERGSQAKRLDNSGLAGLGLFNVAGVIKAHGGEIKVKSNTVEGTTFEFTLPLMTN